MKFESQSKLKEVLLDPDKKLALMKTPLPLSPEELSEMISELPWTGAGKEAIKSFKKAKGIKFIEPKSWFKLGMTLFDGGYYKESFEAFQKVVELNPPKTYHFGAFVWMGHLRDLMGKRGEALKYYSKALKHDTGRPLRHDQYGMQINRQWVLERLKTPFKWGIKKNGGE